MIPIVTLVSFTVGRSFSIYLFFSVGRILTQPPSSQLMGIEGIASQVEQPFGQDDNDRTSSIVSCERHARPSKLSSSIQSRSTSRRPSSAWRSR